MHIGTIELETGAGLAPMAGVTDAAMRLLCREQGAAWAVSEMLSAKGWIYSQGKNRNAAELLARLPGEGVAGLQLFGREPEYVGRAARELEDAGFAFIDLNFGCPAPKITGNGEGSALMREPERLAAVVAAAAAATRLPVTVKIRSGWDEDSVNAPEVALLCQQAGAQAVAVHARTRMQQYSGRADWSIIRRVKQAVTIPVLGNGDVRSGADALRMMLIIGSTAGNDMRYSDEKGQFISIEPKVGENHGGTVLLRELLDFREQGHLSFTDDTSPNFLGYDLTPREFMETGQAEAEENEGQTMEGMQL